MLDFRNNPSDKKFQDEIKFGPGDYYSLFIWAPLEQFGHDVYCQKHPDTKLKLMQMTDNVDKDQRNDNPR